MKKVCIIWFFLHMYITMHGSKKTQKLLSHFQRFLSE